MEIASGAVATILSQSTLREINPMKAEYCPVHFRGVQLAVLSPVSSWFIHSWNRQNAMRHHKARASRRDVHRFHSFYLWIAFNTCLLHFRIALPVTRLGAATACPTATHILNRTYFGRALHVLLQPSNVRTKELPNSATALNAALFTSWSLGARRLLAAMLQRTGQWLQLHERLSVRVIEWEMRIEIRKYASIAKYWSILRVFKITVNATLILFSCGGKSTRLPTRTM